MATRFRFILQYELETLICPEVPRGWNEFEFNFLRSDEMKSVSKKFSERVLRFQNTPKNSTSNPYQFLLNAYNQEGTDAEVRLQVSLYNHMTNSYDIIILDSIIEMSKNATRDKDYFDVTVTESSVMAKYMAQDDVQINPSSSTDLFGNAVTPYNPETITIYGEDLFLQGESDGLCDFNIAGGTLPAGTGIYTTPLQPFVFTVGEINTIGERVQDGTILYNNDSGETINVKIDASYNVNAFVDIQAAIQDNLKLTVRLKRTIGGGTTVIGEQIEPNVPTGHQYNFVFSGIDIIDQAILDTQTISLSIEVELERLTGNNDVTYTIGTTPSQTTYGAEILEIYKGADETRTAKVYFIYPLLSKLLEMATGNGNLWSPLYQRVEDGASSDGQYALLSVASGYMCRNFPISRQPFTCSLKELIQSLYSVHNQGLWFDVQNNRWQLTELDLYYKGEQAIDIGDVSDLNIIAEDSIYFNAVNAGYRNKVDFEDLNGLEAFNVSVDYSIPLKFNKGVLDIRSVFDGSGTQIELVSRKTYKSSAGEDTRWDKNTMFVMCRRDGNAFRTDDATDFDVVENVFDAQNKKNLKLTPQRNLWRHASTLSTVYWKKTGEVVKYLGAQIVSDLRSKLPIEPIVFQENLSFPQDELKLPLWEPEIFEGECGGINYTLFAQLLSDPHGYVRFTYDGQEYSGFILEFPVNLKTQTSQFRLIATGINFEDDYLVDENGEALLTETGDTILKR